MALGRLVLPCCVIVTVCTTVPREALAQARATRSAPSPSTSQPATATPREAAEALVWDRRWDTFDVTDSIVTASMGLGIVATVLVIPEPETPRWQGAILLDGDTRYALRQESENGRETMGTASDWLLKAMIAWPLLDAGVAWGVHGSIEVAAEMMAINAQSFALTLLVTELTKRLVGRERPYGQSCGDGDLFGDCSSGERYKSFLSGHTSMAFTGAGLVCAHHENLPLYGGGLGDAAACATAIGAATAVGALRIASDRHYLSDVILGAALGLVSGYALPSWLHYGIGEDDPDTGQPSGGSITPIATPDGVGFGYQHVWY